MITIILSQVLGIVFLVLGLSLIFNKKSTSALVRGVENDPAMLWTLGFIVLTMGAVVFVLNRTAYPIWNPALDIFVAVLGWAMLLKGAALLIFPNWSVAWYKKFGKDTIMFAGGFVTIVIGLILLYAGFM